jgi:ribosomal protein S18 acetylase RimI-like enzyme
VIPATSASVALPTREISIRRAGIENTENIGDAVYRLAIDSPTAAHWSRTAFYPYLATDAASGALQAKALFFAWVAAATDSSVPNAEFGGVVGFAAFSAIMTIGTGESTLENMAVAESWQRQGIGGRLLTAGFLWCRAHGAGTVFLEVRDGNRPAIELYERAGFSAVGRRPSYYRDPVEDALQMKKLLQPVVSAG